MKRRQLLFWISCPRATPPTLLISIFVSPWYPKWEHVLWTQEAFLCILEVSFSSLSSQNLTKPLVFGILSECNKEANWIYFFLQYSGEETSPCVLSRSKNGEQAFIQFSVSFFPCSSIWQSYQVFRMSSVICGYEELNAFYYYCYLQLDATTNTGNTDSSGTFRFVDHELLAHKSVHLVGLRGWTLHLTGHFI